MPSGKHNIFGHHILTTKEKNKSEQDHSQYGEKLRPPADELYFFGLTLRVGVASQGLSGQ